MPLFLVQNIIAEHEIRNISCAAQDPEDLCTFAYITKDLQTSHHYCHVFSTVDVVRTLVLCSTIDGIKDDCVIAMSPIALEAFICWRFRARSYLTKMGGWRVN